MLLNPLNQCDSLQPDGSTENRTVLSRSSHRSGGARGRQILPKVRSKASVVNCSLSRMSHAMTGSRVPCRLPFNFPHVTVTKRDPPIKPDILREGWSVDHSRLQVRTNGTRPSDSSPIFGCTTSSPAGCWRIRYTQQLACLLCKGWLYGGHCQLMVCPAALWLPLARWGAAGQRTAGRRRCFVAGGTSSWGGPL